METRKRSFNSIIWNPRPLLLLLLLFGLTDLFFAAGSLVASQEQKLVDTILAWIRQPDPGQFENPESVVRFLLTQVAHQDIHNASRVFALREHYDRVSFDVVAQATGTLLPANKMPIPSADLHNVMVVMGQLEDFYRLSLALLGIDPDIYHKVEQVSDWKNKLDMTRLRDLKVQNIKIEYRKKLDPIRRRNDQNIHSRI